MISVIMPAYNCELYIEQAIRSILNQTYRDFEFLICDDGSTDKTLEVIKSIHDDRIRVFQNESNRGYLQTYNFLLSKCERQLITCQDADDWSLPTRLENQIAVFNKFPDVYLCGVNGIFYYDESVQRKCPQFESGYIQLDTDHFHFMLPSVLYRKEVLERVRGFNPYFDRLTSMDQYFVLDVLHHFKGYEINKYLYYARFNPTSNHRTLDFNRKMTATEAYFLLKRQRLTTGTDWLLEGKEDLLLEYENKLLRDRKFVAEKLREYATYKIDSMHLKDASKLLIRAFFKNPFSMTLYRTVFYFFRRGFSRK